MAEWLTTNEDIAAELERIGFIPYTSDRYDFHGSGEVQCLLARIIHREKLVTYASGATELPGFEVHFADRQTFDKWSNSTNFKVRIDPDHPSADLEKAAKQAVKVCQAKVFDWDTYFHTIDLS
jgi:hypothetical protein